MLPQPLSNHEPPTSEPKLTTLKRRTKGCEQCRKRRVKCDETAGFCKQCLRLGLSCSGPTVGSVFVDMTNTARSIKQESIKTERKIPHHAKPKGVQSAKKEGIQIPVISPTNGLSNQQNALISKPWKPSKVQSEAVAAYFSKKPVPMVLPFEADPLLLSEQLFLAQFMDLSSPDSKQHYECTTSPWMLSIQEQMSCAKMESFKHSIRAASSAFHAFIKHDPAAQDASFKWYVAGLQTYRKHLSTKPMKKNGPPPGIEEVLIPVFLCMFEIVNCTTAAGCFQHLDAAARIIQQRGPENCQTGIIHEMFVSLRVSDACVAIADGRKSAFGSKEWRTIPFLRSGHLPPLHYLVDILLQIPDALVVTTDPKIHFCDYLSSVPNFYVEKRSLIEARSIELLEQLSKWWLDFEFENSMNSYNEGSQGQDPHMQYSPTTFIFTDSFTAFVVSVYDACSLILHATLHEISSLPYTSHLAQAMSHAESILRISKFQQETCPVGFDLIRSTFALKTVENMGPGHELRERAAILSLGWEQRGLIGILAAEIGSPETRSTPTYMRDELLPLVAVGGATG